MRMVLGGFQKFPRDGDTRDKKSFSWRLCQIRNLSKRWNPQRPRWVELGPNVPGGPYTEWQGPWGEDRVSRQSYKSSLFSIVPWVQCWRGKYWNMTEGWSETVCGGSWRFLIVLLYCFKKSWSSVESGLIICRFICSIYSCTYIKGDKNNTIYSNKQLIKI